MSKNIPAAHGKGEQNKVDASTTETAKPKKEVRIVTMEDGTQLNFGTRANLLSSIDLETNTLTFKLVSGKIINWILQGVEGLTDFQRTVFLYGILEKVKTSLAPIKLPKIEEAIAKQIVAIEKGEFNIRSLSGSGEVTLTELQAAYAIALSKQSKAKAHWVNTTDVVTIQEVLSVWEGKSPAQRNAIRRNAAVSWELNVMKLEEGNVEGLDTL